MLVDKLKPGVHVGCEISDVLGERNEGCLEVDGIEDTDEVVVDNAHFRSECCGAPFSMSFLGK